MSSKTQLISFLCNCYKYRDMYVLQIFMSNTLTLCMVIMRKETRYFDYEKTQNYYKFVTKKHGYADNKVNT